ncbi:hypothetical protein EYZ11_005181 [Aspergillus tanneri]|uniref:Ig-like domain-containing protein n=1 Tax=Aspergillus tanneri TaxID=1220188 RepID=A0A4S3JPF2_9EURO|nr:hypothetical protein EYZ11_005181 [Aspergillus tanneri]
MQSSMLKISLLTLLGVSIALPTQPASANNKTLEERQIFPDYICCDGGCLYEIIGDGDPHTDYLHRQLTQIINCKGGPGADGCSGSYNEGNSFAYTVTGGAAVSFFNGGFSVSETWSESETYTCMGKEDADAVCIWYDMAYRSSYGELLHAAPWTVVQATIVSMAKNTVVIKVLSIGA